MKIVYCDLIAYEGLHTGFNSAMIKVFDLTFKPQIIEFYAEKTHINICKNNIDEKNVVFHNFQYLPKSMVGGLKTILKDLIGCLYVLKAFFSTQKDDVICIALAYPLAQLALFLLNKFFRRSNVFVCQHGELEMLVNKSDYPTLKRYYFSIEEKIFNQKSKIINIILGETIYNNIIQKFPKLNVIVIDHPYLFNYVNPSEPDTQFNPLIIGVIGSTGLNKGTHYVFQLAELLKDYILKGELKIKIVGKLAEIYKDLDSGLVEHQHSSLLPEEIFKAEIESLHYSLLFRNDNMNKMTASGTFLDAVKFKKPFLSLKGEYIGYYHKKNPDAGELYDDVIQIAERIRCIIENKTQFSLAYLKSVNAIIELQNDLSIINIAKNFRSQLQ